MRIEFTLAGPVGSQDVAITAPADVPIAAVHPALAEAAGASNDAALWLGEQALGEQSPVSDIPFGALLRLGSPGPYPTPPAILSLQVVGGPDAGLVVPLSRGQLCIGRGAGCDVPLTDADVSRRHAALTVQATTITIRDLGSTNGTTVDGAPIGAEAIQLAPGSLVGMGDTLLLVAGPGETPATLRPASEGRRLMLRPPRRYKPAGQGEIELPVLGGIQRPRGVQWITALLPAAAGGAIAWFAHSPQFLLFALLSPVMMISTALGDRVHWRRSRRREAATYRRRRAAAEQQIRTALDAETTVRRELAPDPVAVLRIASLPSSRLWERRDADADFLSVRLGTAELPSATRTRHGSELTPAGTVSAVPVTLDLRQGPLGVGGPAEVVTSVSRWLVAQLATLHSPADVELALLLSPDASQHWSWARWLPHLRGRVAVSEHEWGSLVADLGEVVEQRVGLRARSDARWRGPWLVLVVDRAAQLADVPGLAALLTDGAAVGVTAICFDIASAGLPTGCVSVARVAGESGSRAAIRQPGEQNALAVLDQVGPAWAADVARHLARFVDAAGKGEAALPNRCSLAEVLDLATFDCAAIARRWELSSGGAHTTLGLGVDGPLTVDLVADGPHALIAGTTGSGKSELLQSLVAGLATNHPPDELNLLLIDYKGGAAFAECAHLPHTAGLVTDLDPYLTERALRSLNSELRRRERIFADAGVADLESYRAGRSAEAVPRLLIVVDEFAALAAELPDFVRGLIGVAQRGRSLGVHLVLATQRPGNAVSAEIRANTSLRIALRVTDPGESSDVIDAPEAATLTRAYPGRAYLRCGAALSCFQTAHAGSRSTDPTRPTVELLGPWRRTLASAATASGPTDIARLVQAVRQAARSTGRKIARPPWVDPLPEAVLRSALPAPERQTVVPLGLIDLPEEQRRETFSFDLAAGTALLAVGAARSGRTALLASLAIGAADQLAPDLLHVYVIDGGGGLAQMLAPLPHCATCLGSDELDLAPRLLTRLERECTSRVAAQASGPTMLLLIDGWDTLLAALPDIDAASCTDLVTNLLRVGPVAGLNVVVTGDRSALAPRFAGGFANRILLRMPDRGDYGLAGVAARDVPTQLPPGRGLRGGDGAVLQIVHAGALTDVQAAVNEVARRWSPLAAPVGRIHIRSLPAKIALDDLPATSPGRLALGLVGDELSPASFDPFDGARRLLVAGPPRSGRTTLLRSLAQQASNSGIAAVVAAPARSPLAQTARQLDLALLSPTQRTVGTLPETPTLLLIDDGEAFNDVPAGDELLGWLHVDDAALAVVVVGRTEELATSYRGVGAEVRRHHCGILLRPGPIDGELLGIRLPRRPSFGPPGRGVVVGDPTWGPLFRDGDPLPIQVATP